MPSMSLARFFTCIALVHSAFKLHGTDGQRTVKENKTGVCQCPDKKGNIYNLASLQRRDGSARLEGKSKDFVVRYNPCGSFSYTSEKDGDCSDGDVAICLSSRTYDQNIGTQSSAACGFDENDIPQLEYSHEITQGVWKAIVNLKCDEERKGPDSGLFEITSLGGEGVYSQRTFQLSHNCACASHCPVDPTTPNPTGNLVEKIALPAGICSGIFIVVSLVIYHWRQRNNHRNNNPPIIGDGGIGYETINNICQTEGKIKNSNLKRSTSPPISVSSRSCTDIKELSKDGMSNGGKASAPV